MKPIGVADWRHSLGYAVGVLLLLPYLLPRTWLASISPLSYIDLLHRGASTPLTLTLVAGAFTAVWLSYHSVIPARPDARRLCHLVGIYGAVFIVTAAAALRAGQSPAGPMLVLISLTVGLLAARFCGSGLRAARILCWLGALQALYALGDCARGYHILQSHSAVLAGGTLNDPESLANILLFCLPLGAALALTETAAVAQFAALVGSAAMAGALVLSADIAALAGALLGVVWFAYTFCGRNRRVAIAGFFVAAAVSTVCYAHLHQGLNRSVAGASIRAEAQVYRRGWSDFRRNWITGSGAGGAGTRTPAGGRGDEVRIGPVSETAVPLLWIDEMGIAGGVLLILFLWSIAPLVSSGKGPDARILAAAWVAVIAAGCV